jgi:hypothetical protein
MEDFTNGSTATRDADRILSNDRILVSCLRVG